MGQNEKLHKIYDFLKTAEPSGKPKKPNLFRSAYQIIIATRHGGSLSEETRLKKVRDEIRGYKISPSIARRKQGRYPSIRLTKPNGEEIIL